MSRRNLNAVVRYLQQLAHTQPGSGASDAELLERYIRHRDEAAFELLVWRHGALVFNVCRRMLPCEQDAEDAFQATFLAFVRKAGSISRRASVAAWLYRVAFRVALAAKARRVKIAAHEKPYSEVQAATAVNDPKWAEFRPILDEEVNRLPERLRRPFVLCYLEGKTNEEAARQLRCPPGTIFSRLARGREMLRRRLQRRGVTLSVTALTAALTTHAAQATPAAALMTATVRNAFLFAAGQAVSGVSTQATALAEGVLRTMFMTKIKLTALMMLLAGLFAVGGVFARQALDAARQPEDSKDKPVVSVVQPTPGGLQRTSRYTGHARAVAQQQVYPVVSGYLKRIAVDIGDAVKKGDVLAEVDAPLLEMEVRQARAALALEEREVKAAEAEVNTAMAEVKLVADRASALESKLKGDEAFVAFRRKQAARYKGLLRDQAIDQRLVDEQEDQLHAAIQTLNSTKQALQNVRSEIAVKESKVQSAKAVVETARSKLEIGDLSVQKAQAQLGFAVLRANLDGVVIGRNVSSGDFVFSSEQGGRRPLLTVLRTDPIRVVVNVAESDVPFIRPGVSVHLEAAMQPDIKLPDCTVSRTGFVIDEKTGTMQVEMDVPNPKNLLRPGMFIRALLVLDKKAPAGAVAVPATAVVKRKEHSYIFIVRDDKAHLTPVRVSYEEGDRVEIESGVRASDRIVIDPRGLEGEAVPVEVKKTP